MRRGLPVVLRFIVGSFPVFMGFACLGLSLYSEHSIKFNSLRNSLMTLFSLMNGDVLLETVRDIQDGFMGDLYLVAFMCIFAFAILSVFVSIIQDSYQSAKKQTAQQALPKRSRSGVSGAAGGISHMDAEALMNQLAECMDVLSAQMRECREMQEQLCSLYRK
eukprot:CAMPEP_0118941710 /NCGR_PEP_ID=MMETSP1169-20130426/34471_1 /TAXON_ID=36882 /ORGANISM="Pyramimonas obovata, Strain CCMP722" /LENGTH=162 /DNA_ID=CAMNT_0006886539 /DNA_START=1 /DNA_END=486 /DNA_ORIENTATION=-